MLCVVPCWHCVGAMCMYQHDNCYQEILEQSKQNHNERIYWNQMSNYLKVIYFIHGYLKNRSYFT